MNKELGVFRLLLRLGAKISLMQVYYITCFHVLFELSNYGLDVWMLRLYSFYVLYGGVMLFLPKRWGGLMND